MTNQELNRYLSKKTLPIFRRTEESDLNKTKKLGTSIAYSGITEGNQASANDLYEILWEIVHRLSN